MEHKAPIILIAAVADNGIIGDSATNSLPWGNLDGDLKRFKETTIGNGNNVVIMGRKTFESLPFKPLKGRINLVLTENPGWVAPEGAFKFSNLEEGIAEFTDKCDEIYIIGGASVYQEALQFADQMILTRVHQNPEGDVYFPEFDPEEWIITKTESFPEFGYDVVYYQRKNTSVH